MMGKNIKITGKVGFIIGILIISLFPVKLLSQYPNWTVYDTTNSGLPSNVVWAIAIDGSGNKWIGTRGGLAVFDGTNWTVYNTSNSGLPSDWILAIAIDDMGNKWIGTIGGGLAEFDGTNWTVYNTSNSGLPDNYVDAIAIDASGNKWIGTESDGLAVYSGGTGIEEEDDEKVEIGTMKVYPNPFTGITRIRYGVPDDVDVNISIYNLLGQKVAILVNGNKKAGYYTAIWDGSKLSAGIYFIKLKAGEYNKTLKVMLMK